MFSMMNRIALGEFRKFTEAITPGHYSERQVMALVNIR
jgi:hypothetical protein